MPAPLSPRMLEQLDDFIARTRHPAMLATEIPYWSDIERMTVRRAPLPAIAPASPAARLYTCLWQEISVRIAAVQP